MLEALVSSRIRRALLEYLLSHPQDRFYLRGLAKELGLSVSPLRRELKRLERAGALKAMPEGNMLFYSVDPKAPILLQARQATGWLPEPVAVAPATPYRRAAWWTGPLRQPALVAATGVMTALFLLIIGVAYLSMTNQRFASQVSRALTTRRADVTVVVPSASGAMRGGRWQILPGGFGGFSGGVSDESY